MTSNPSPNINTNSSLNKLKKRRTNYSILKLSTLMMVVTLLPKAKILWAMRMQLTRSGNASETNFNTRPKTVEKLIRICWKSLLTTISWSRYLIAMQRLKQKKVAKQSTTRLRMKIWSNLETRASFMVMHLTRTWMPRSHLYPNLQWNNNTVFRSLANHLPLWLMPHSWNPQSQLKSVRPWSRILKEKNRLNLSEMHKKSSQKSAPSNQKLIPAARWLIKRSPGRSVGIVLLSLNLRYRSKEIKPRLSKRSTKFKSTVPFNHNLATELLRHSVDVPLTQ